MLAADPGGGGHREQHTTSHFDLRGRDTHTTLERIRPCAALLPANVASSALTSVSNEPRRHFRVLLDRTESP